MIFSARHENTLAGECHVASVHDHLRDVLASIYCNARMHRAWDMRARVLQGTVQGPCVRDAKDTMLLPVLSSTFFFTVDRTRSRGRF